MHQELSSSINLVSFNVNGLGQEEKRKSVFEKRKQLDCMSFLQEAFSTKTLKPDGKMNGEVKYYLIMEHAIAGE